VLAGAASVRIASLVPGVPYRFRVFAFNNVGNSEPSDWSERVTPGDSVVRPGSELNIAADANGAADSSGVAGTNGAVLSGDGRYAFFMTRGDSNLAPPDVRDPARRQNYLVRRDLRTGEMVLASRALDGRTPQPVQSRTNQYSWRQSFAANRDGTVVTFLASGRLFVHSIPALSTWDGSAGMAAPVATAPNISVDGTVVSFVNRGSSNESTAWRTVRGQNAQRVDQCHYACTDSVRTEVSMSDDGNTLVYDDRVTNLDRHVFRYDAASGQTTDLMAGIRPEHYDEGAMHARISGDGRMLVLTYQYQQVGVDYAAAVVRTTLGGPITVAQAMARTGYLAYAMPFDLTASGDMVTYHFQPGGITDYIYGYTGDQLPGPTQRRDVMIDTNDDGRYVVWSRWTCTSYANCSPTAPIYAIRRG
jgi:hypothetical protein